MSVELFNEMRAVDGEIKNLENELLYLETRLYNLSKPLTDYKGATKPQGKDYIALIEQIDTLKRIINERLVEAFQKKIEVEVIFNMLPFNEAKLMKARYCNGLSWRTVANQCGYSLPHTYTLHRAIMRKIKSILNNSK